MLVGLRHEGRDAGLRFFDSIIYTARERYFVRFLMRMAAIDAAEAARAAGSISTPVWMRSLACCATGCEAGM